MNRLDFEQVDIPSLKLQIAKIDTFIDILRGYENDR